MDPDRAEVIWTLQYHRSHGGVIEVGHLPMAMPGYLERP
jgi:hypothetical protein